MSLERDQELIGEYVEWSARMKTMAHDVSPERFVVEKAKQEAFERVEAAIEYIHSLVYEEGMSGQQTLSLYAILTGEDE